MEYLKGRKISREWIKMQRTKEKAFYEEVLASALAAKTQAAKYATDNGEDVPKEADADDV